MVTFMMNNCIELHFHAFTKKCTLFLLFAKLLCIVIRLRFEWMLELLYSELHTWVSRICCELHLPVCYWAQFLMFCRMSSPVIDFQPYFRSKWKWYLSQFPLSWRWKSVCCYIRVWIKLKLYFIVHMNVEIYCQQALGGKALKGSITYIILQYYHSFASATDLHEIAHVDGFMASSEYLKNFKSQGHSAKK